LIDWLLVEFSAVGDGDLGLGLATLAAIRLHLLDHVQTLHHLSKDHMLAIQPLGFDGAEEKLAAIGVGSSVGHGEDPGTGVLQLEVLVLELITVNGLASSAVVVGEVATLAHKLRNDAVEGGGLEAEALFTGAERAEILGRLGHDVAAQFHDDAADRSSVRRDVHEDAWQRHGCLGRAEERHTQSRTCSKIQWRQQSHSYH
jgi:hypothetical protein